MLLLVAALTLRYGFGIDLFGGGANPDQSPDARGAGGTTSTATRSGSGVAADLDAAIRGRRSEVWVEFEAGVSKLRPDDDDGDRHQRFIVRIADGRTLLVAHNIDIAPRIPLERGDRVVVRGKYVWNDQGGVVHWTHRAESRNRDAGWIEFGSVRYE